MKPAKSERDTECRICHAKKTGFGHAVIRKEVNAFTMKKFNHFCN